MGSFGAVWEAEQCQPHTSPKGDQILLCKCVLFSFFVGLSSKQGQYKVVFYVFLFDLTLTLLLSLPSWFLMHYSILGDTVRVRLAFQVSCCVLLFAALASNPRNSCAKQVSRLQKSAEHGHEGDEAKVFVNDDEEQDSQEDSEDSEGSEDFNQASSWNSLG